MKAPEVTRKKWFRRVADNLARPCSTGTTEATCKQNNKRNQLENEISERVNQEMWISREIFRFSL